MIKVKICGIRTLEDAQVAAQAGADLVGLVFVPGRRRRLDTKAARAIAVGLKASRGEVPQVVGLFADQPLDEVNQVIETCGLDLAQLCGGESLDYCGQTRCPVIKVLHVANSPSTPPLLKGGRGDFSTEQRGPWADGPDIANLEQRIRAYRAAGHLVTLDRLVEGLQGGTGHSFNWEVAARLSQRGLSFLLAGGLSPENVAQAVATVRPWGVDVSSGVETDGAKDHEKIRAFIENDRQLTASNTKLTADR